MTAPESPEVEAAELAAAEERIANLEAGRDTEQQMLRNAVGQLVALKMRYDAALELVQEAHSDRAEFKAERDTARADLARALPVVEAAGAYIAHLDAATTRDGRWLERNQVLLDALARAVHAAREPRTETPR